MGVSVWELVFGSYCVGVIVWELLCGSYCVGVYVLELVFWSYSRGTKVAYRAKTHIFCTRKVYGWNFVY